MKTKKFKTISFKEWCKNNKREDLLNRWNYELNKCSPNEISKSSGGFNNKGYYFKCPLNKHKSEIKSIANIARGQKSDLCKACNSFAQWGMDNFCDKFLEKYWDYDKNTANPWWISKKSNKKFYIKCQVKEYHGSYDVSLNNFSAGKRCPFCGRANEKVHKLDSLGSELAKEYGVDFIKSIFSNKNNKNLFEVSKKSHQIMWWKCINDKHEDYQREIANSHKCKFRCPKCNNSMGEIRISSFLEENDIDFIQNKEFKGLIGLGFGNLSYDFYLEKYNLLIEFNGKQHEKFVKGFQKSNLDFIKQVEHDKRKYNYAIDNNIELLVIWHYEYEEIYSILSKWLEVNNT